jgi:hypothetical protein
MDGLSGLGVDFILGNRRLGRIPETMAGTLGWHFTSTTHDRP